MGPILQILTKTALAAFAVLFLASPAYAADSVSLSGPDGLTLLSLGLAGLLIGRRAAAKRKGD